MQPDPAVINGWSGAAPFWEKHREIIRQMFAPVTQALIEDGLIGSRHAVLDIATGPGEPALSVAALVGPEGKVFGIDPVPEMVAAARRASDHLGFGNIQFDVAATDHLPFQISEKLRDKVATLSREQFTEVKHQALEALREYSTDRGMSFPAQVLIVSGTKSASA